MKPNRYILYLDSFDWRSNELRNMEYVTEYVFVDTPKEEGVYLGNGTWTGKYASLINGTIDTNAKTTHLCGGL
jgi:hypothetical protein